MSLFALTLSPLVRAEWVIGVEVTFILYALLSFIAVSTYAAKKIRAGRLINGRAAPRPFSIPPAGAWLFGINMAALLVMPSVLYIIAVLGGLLLVCAIDGQRAQGRALLPQAGGWLFALNILTLLLMQSPLYMVLVVAGLVVLLFECGRTARQQFGLARLTASQLVRWSLLICGAVIVVVSPLMGLLNFVLNAVHLSHPEQQSVETFRQFTRPSQIFDFMIQAVVIAPMIEELFFRGFLLTFLKNYTSAWTAMVLSAGVFAVAHVNLGSMLPLWVLGIVLAVAYEHTGSLLLPMGIHACFNLATGLSLLMDKGNS
jgi:membrane protease YdiL (CAAX protease family)